MFPAKGQAVTADSPVASLPCRVLTPENGTGGVPVLLLHTFTSNGADDWPEAGLPAALTAAGRPVYIPDLPGHGASARPGTVDSVSTSSQAAALAAVIAGMPGDSVDIVGYSLGARLAWSLARISPRRVGHLVLGGLSPFEPFGALDMGSLTALVRDGAAPQDPLTAMIGGMITAPGRDSESLLSVIEGLRAEPFQPEAWAPDVPVLFVRGDEDQVAAGMEALAAAVKGSRMLTVPGDHMQVLHGSAFQQAALDFINS